MKEREKEWRKHNGGLTFHVLVNAKVFWHQFCVKTGPVFCTVYFSYIVEVGRNKSDFLILIVEFALIWRKYLQIWFRKMKGFTSFSSLSVLYMVLWIFLVLAFVYLAICALLIHGVRTVIELGKLIVVMTELTRRTLFPTGKARFPDSMDYLVEPLLLLFRFWRCCYLCRGNASCWTHLSCCESSFFFSWQRNFQICGHG